MDMNNHNIGKLEDLKGKIQHMQNVSQDRFFNEYLSELQKRVVQEEAKIDELCSEFDRNYKIYLDRNNSQKPAEVVYVSSNLDNGQVQTSNLQNTNAQNFNVNSQYTNPWVDTNNKRNMPAPPPFPGVPPYQKLTTKNSAEFTIGASLLGVIGGIFILVALVIFGMNYMTGFVKGMCLYAVCGVVLALSELLIHRRVKKLSSILSSIAIGGLYISTAVNFLSLKNFGMWPALGITFIISCVVLLLGKKRNSSIYKVIGIFAGYASFLMIQDGIGDAEFLVVASIMLIVNFVYALVQVKENAAIIDIIHMIFSAIFTFAFATRAGYCDVDTTYIMVLVVASTILIHLILINRIKNNRVEAKERLQNGFAPCGNEGIITAYAVSALIYSVMVSLILTDIDVKYFISDQLGELDMGKLVTMLSLTAVAGIAFVILHIMKASEKWYIYCYVNLLAFVIYIAGVFNAVGFEDGKGTESIVCLSVCLVISKIVSLSGHIRVRICDSILTFFSLWTIVWMTVFSEGMLVYILLAAILFGLILISGWKTSNEIMLVSGLAFYTVSNMPSMLKLPAVAGIMFVTMLLFNHFKRYKDKYVIVYNVYALFVQTVSLLLLINPVYRNAYITYLCMLVFGVATIVLIFQKKYGMGFRMKNLILAIFLTYMGLIFKSSQPILNSIILMVVALVCVGVGFSNRQKFLRIYGLILALGICGKIVLYDFIDINTMQKIILFFAVGVIALIIAGIYIILEKKSNLVKEQ